MWCHLQNVVLHVCFPTLEGRDFLADAQHGFCKTVEFLQALALRRLHHQGAGHRPRHRGCVETVVDETLGDVHDFDAHRFEGAAIEDHFVGHRPVLRLVQHVVRTFQTRLQVVRVEDGHLGALGQA